MKSRTFLVLCIVAAVLGGVAYLAFAPGGGDDASPQLGRPLFDSFPHGTVASLSVRSTEVAVTLRRDEKGWIVVQRSGFPADFAKISQLVEKVASLKIGRQLALSDSVRSELALFPPDGADHPAEQRSTRVTMADSGGKAVVDLFVGKPRNGSASGSGGQYLYRAGDKVAYLVDQTFPALASEPGDWIQPQVVDIPADAVRQVDCLSAEGETVHYTAARPARGETPVIQGVETGQGQRKVKTSAIDTLFDALSSFRAEDVADASDSRVSDSGDRRFRYHLYDGRVFTVYPGIVTGGEEERQHVRLTVAFAGPAAEEPAESGKEAGGADQKVDDDIIDARSTAQEDAHLTPWVYFVAKWTYDSFAPSLDALLESPAATPGTAG